jgi:transcriptional regulator GlxA family with amidase domain
MSGQTSPRRVGFVGFDGVNALDLVGPLEVFASTLPDDGAAAYETVVIGATDRAFVADSGVLFKPSATFATAPPLDTLVVPGGSGLRQSATNARVAAWVRSRALRTRRVASVCTGVYGLAATGLLDGRRVATHWRFADPLQRAFPRLRVDADALFVKDGRFYTSAGITAGLDLALALVEEDWGPARALAVARELVMYVKRPGGQEQYSEPLRFQTESGDRLADVAAWMGGHLAHDLSVPALARRAHLCPRHFARVFKQAFSRTPAAFALDLRLTEARRRLAARAVAVGAVAASVGFRSDDAFRRAFLRRFGVTPGAYRARFGRAAF